MLFGTSKQLNLFHDRQVNLSVNGSPVNTTICYDYLCVHLNPTRNFSTHFHTIYKEAGRVNLLWHIRSSIDTFSAQRIYQSMIMAILKYCGLNSLKWSPSRKCMIVITPKCSPKNCDLRFLAIDNFLQKKTCSLFSIASKKLYVSHSGIVFNDFTKNSLNTIETMGNQQNYPRWNWILRAVVFIS